MIDFDSVKVYSPGYDATHWGFDYPQIVDFDTALAQPQKIAVMPVFYDRPTEFSYRPEFATVNLEPFDLVLFTDIEFRPQTELIKWIETTGVQNWLLSVGGLWDHETLSARTVYRPAWSFTFLQWNPPRDDFPLERPFLFDCLCGTRRRHRDYVMLSMIKSGLLDRSVVTYRDVFVGGDIQATPPEVQAEFPNLRVPWPYVSPNLDPAWEVRDRISNDVSSIVPWEIYNRTWYSILVETLGFGGTYLMAEKIGKCLLARRLFVHFGVQGWLQQLRSFGFETFGSVLDESYDHIKDNVSRWRAAFEQVQYLSQQDHPALLQKVRPLLDHNHHRLFEFRQQKRDQMRTLIDAYLK
jgi:hypothetical protein